MQILLTTPDPEVAASDYLRPGNIVHAPALHDAPPGDLLDALRRYGATGLVAARRPESEVLRQWSGHHPGGVFVGYAAGRPPRTAHPGVCEHRQPGAGLESVGALLRRCEQWFTLRRPPGPAGDPPDGARRDVVVIGAGIVDLITALHLSESGYAVTVLDRSPEPGSADWHRYGCTFAGDDARMFTLTEMDCYTNRDPWLNSPDHFRTPVEKLGWLASDRPHPTPEEEKWIDEFERIPSWLTRAYTEDVFALNADAGDRWRSLRQRHSALFEDVVLADDILRVYSDPLHLGAALARHRGIGAVLREFTPEDLARDVPALGRALREGALSGGFLVPGFTLNVHKFSRRIIDHLVRRGVSFHWNTPVTGVRRDAGGQVTGFDCPLPLPAGAHVVASPGAHGQRLLDGSPCQGRIHGVLGGWLRISNAGTGLRTSLKVARRGHVTEDANVTVARDADGREILVVGSGYGYVGSDPGAVDGRQLDAVRRGILDTVRRILPGSALPALSSDPAENYDFKFCVRPWTSTSLGLHHTERTAGGGLFVITGGHNTGGFAQAPAVAGAVLASLRGEPHPMHRLYRPDRFTAFADTTTEPAAGTARQPVTSAT
ncbi:FAD-dependent oxidoreductase [Streptomyces sp. NPDC002055]|uniref:NAD(P)/FAD-dependent oxidoreductase n=1 Tax=Streptomyces sp. NPDC002055 TaxID=3154534 RepID=UPI0033290E20